MKAIRLGKHMLALAGLSMALAAHAAEVPYTAAKLQQALAAGQPTVVYVHATWCPTCHIQEPIVQRISQEAAYQPVTIFVADFDKEAVLKKSLKVTMQSTFVVFKQGHEVTRSTGQTQEAAIRATLKQAL